MLAAQCKRTNHDGGERQLHGNRGQNARAAATFCRRSARRADAANIDARGGLPARSLTGAVLPTF